MTRKIMGAFWGIIFSVFVWHVLAPERYHWLNQNQWTMVICLLCGAAIAGIIKRASKYLNNNYRD